MEDSSLPDYIMKETTPAALAAISQAAQRPQSTPLSPTPTKGLPGPAPLPQPSTKKGQQPKAPLQKQEAPPKEPTRERASGDKAEVYERALEITAGAAVPVSVVIGITRAMEEFDGQLQQCGSQLSSSSKNTREVLESLRAAVTSLHSTIAPLHLLYAPLVTLQDPSPLTFLLSGLPSVKGGLVAPPLHGLWPKETIGSPSALAVLALKSETAMCYTLYDVAKDLARYPGVREKFHQILATFPDRGHVKGLKPIPKALPPFSSFAPGAEARKAKEAAGTWAESIAKRDFGRTNAKIGIVAQHDLAPTPKSAILTKLAPKKLKAAAVRSDRTDDDRDREIKETLAEIKTSYAAANEEGLDLTPPAIAHVPREPEFVVYLVENEEERQTLSTICDVIPITPETVQSCRHVDRFITAYRRRGHYPSTMSDSEVLKEYADKRDIPYMAVEPVKGSDQDA